MNNNFDYDFGDSNDPSADPVYSYFVTLVAEAIIPVSYDVFTNCAEPKDAQAELDASLVYIDQMATRLAELVRDVSDGSE